MAELQIINEQELLGKHFRIYGTAEQPLFLAKDVAEWIEHSNARVMLNTVEDSEKVVNNVYTLGGNQESWFLTEGGLYEVLMQSRKPIAKEFKKKVKEILKSIRQNGGYIVGQEEMSDTELLAKALMVAQKTIERREFVIKQLESDIEEMRPKQIFADAVATSHTSILIGDLAKLISQNGYEIGQKRLFEWLRNNGYLIKGGNSKNMPMQRFVEQGLFEVKESTQQSPDGSVRITRTTKVTGKGQIYFVNKFLKGSKTKVM